jgi:hypothetical protein
MDATTLLIMVYCQVDEWLAGRRLRQRGPKPILADSEVLASVVTLAAQAAQPHPGRLPMPAGRPRLAPVRRPPQQLTRTPG